MKVIVTEGCFENRPTNAYKDLRGVGYKNFVLNMNLMKSGAILSGTESIKYAVEEFMDQTSIDGIEVSVAKTPVFTWELKKYAKAALDRVFKESINAAIVFGCRSIIVEPPMQDIEHPLTEEEIKVFYKSLIPLVKDSDVCIVIINQPTTYNGNQYHGILSDSYEFLEFINDLNKISGRQAFRMAIDTAVAYELGQKLPDLIGMWGDLLEVILIGDEYSYTEIVKSLRSIEYDRYIIFSKEKDYIKLPSPLRNDFVAYLKKHADYLEWQINLEKTIRKYDERVLFGAGNMCKAYMEYYGRMFPPKYTCDNNSSKWGQIVYGLEIKNPEELRKLDSDVAIFICNTFYDEITKQLLAMNLPNPIERFNDEIL